jgi:biofilm PGA synthesis N-glycosyltransferase PgaC
MFVSIYSLFFTFILYFNNKKELFSSPTAKHTPSVSFVVPAHNEEETIQDTVEHIFAIDYPKILEVIVVNDASSDRTREIVEKLQKKYSKLILINNDKPFGNAARTKNAGLKYAKGDLIAFVDADSYPAKDSLKKMVGFFDDEKVGAVTCSILLRDPKNFLEKMQDIEYRVIALVRKLLEFVDAVYVTPGPLALYRKKALDEINGYDNDNITEDIEIAWHLLHEKWKIRMCLATSATTTAPKKIKGWYKQRLRWAIGGLECISKYKQNFLEKGTFGQFIIPLFIFQFFMGIIGLGVFFYVLVHNFLSNYIFVKYSVSVGTPLLTMNSLYITPSFLNYLGVILFIVGFLFTLIVLSVMKKVVLKKQGFFSLLFYSFFYLMMYPLIALHSIYKYFKGGYTWK